MGSARWVLVLPAVVLCTVLAAGRGSATCSRDALEAVRAELRVAAAPSCGSRRVRRAFDRARKRMALVAARAARDCARGATPGIGPAHGAVARALGKIAASSVGDTCAARYAAALSALEADLDGAVAGGGTTTTTTTPPDGPTTTAPPGSPTTTLPAPCTTITLEVDRGDCTRVVSDPPGLVTCDATCDVETFTVPATGTLQLRGTPAHGDKIVVFDTDCLEDGTVPLDTASPPDCALSCDCSSGF